MREWAHNQAAAKLLSWSEDADGVERFTMTPEAIAVLSDPDHPAFGMGMFHRLPQTMQTLEPIAESFRTGIGLDYDAFGPEGAAGIERSFGPWYRNFLVPVALPALDGVVPMLEDGAHAIDIGCGAGIAVLTMAAQYPKSTFDGYDISEHALARAESSRAEKGLANAGFHNARRDPIPSDRSVDFITTFDCIHDMTDPVGMMETIRSAIKDDGVWLLVDIKGRDSFAENIEKNPMAPMMYGVSVMSCMSSALVRARRRGARHAGPARVARPHDDRRRRLHPVPPPRHRPPRERLLRGPPVARPELGRRLHVHRCRDLLEGVGLEACRSHGVGEPDADRVVHDDVPAIVIEVGGTAYTAMPVVSKFFTPPSNPSPPVLLTPKTLLITWLPLTSSPPGWWAWIVNPASPLPSM